jgi:hypothetical protein
VRFSRPTPDLESKDFVASGGRSFQCAHRVAYFKVECLESDVVPEIPMVGLALHRAIALDVLLEQLFQPPRKQHPMQANLQARHRGAAGRARLLKSLHLMRALFF